MMNRYILLGVLGLFAFLPGCAQMVFDKPGLRPGEFEADHFDCQVKVGQMYGGLNKTEIGYAIASRQDMINCFRSKGYTQKSSS